MRILFLSDNFPPEVNATASRVFERAVYWARWGHDVTVLTCVPNFPVGKVFEGYENRWIQREKMEGINVIRVKTFIAKNEGFALRVLDFLSYMFMAIAVGGFLRRPDVIVSTSPQFFTAVAGHILSVIKRRPFVFEIGDLWPESIRAVGAMKNETIYSMLEKLELYLYRKSASIVAQTPAFKANLVARGVSPNKISVILNGVDSERYKPVEKTNQICDELGIRRDRFVIGYVGTHGMAHDLYTILDAAKMMQSNEQLCFLFIGEGAEKRNLIEYRSRNGIENVEFRAAVPKDKIVAVWSLCDIVVIPLRNRPTFSTVVPSKLFEAMAMGKLIILMAPMGEASKILNKHNAGVHIEPELPELLRDTIVKLMGDGEIRTRYRLNTLAAADNYTRKKQASRMIGVLHQLHDPTDQSFPDEGATNC